MADAERRFDEYVDRWQLDIDRPLYRALKRAALLPYKNERALLERLAAGNAVIAARPGLTFEHPIWQRWLAILAAWASCWETMEEDKHEALTATEAAALIRTDRRPIEFSLGKAQ